MAAPVDALPEWMARLARGIGALASARGEARVGSVREVPRGQRRALLDLRGTSDVGTDVVITTTITRRPLPPAPGLVEDYAYLIEWGSGGALAQAIVDAQHGRQLTISAATVVVTALNQSVWPQPSGEPDPLMGAFASYEVAPAAAPWQPQRTIRRLAVPAAATNIDDAPPYAIAVELQTSGTGTIEQLDAAGIVLSGPQAAGETIALVGACRQVRSANTGAAPADQSLRWVLHL